jgi:hypothetical protein
LLNRYSPNRTRASVKRLLRELFRFTALAAIFCFFSACAVDPSAVQSFSGLAPDQTKLDALTQAYADVPAKLIDLDVLHRLSQNEQNALIRDEATRKSQLSAIDGIHAVLVNYMKALGALASDTLVQTSTDTTTLTKGLTALQTAEPTLGITTAQITAVGDLSKLLADAATSFYREQQLSDVISRANAPFQQLVATEQQIVSRGVLPDLQNLLDRTRALKEVTHGLQVASDQQVSEASARETARAERHQKGPEQEQIDPRLRGSGAADVASLLLLKHAIASDTVTINQQIQAAKDYSTALDKIAKAHAALYNARDNVLSEAGAKTFLEQQGSTLNEAYAALQALNKL